MVRYRASKHDCDPCALKPKCCPNTPARKIPRSIHEGARDMARDIAKTEAYVTSRRESTSNASSDWIARGYEGRMELEMSSTSQPQPKTSGNSQS